MTQRFLLGIDIGTSSIKASLLDADTGKNLAHASSPDYELAVSSPSPGFAEQSPDLWWEHAKRSIASIGARFDLKNVAAVGIAYQMHGLVMIDKNGESIRPSIIWCDSRAVPYGEQAAEKLGDAFCKEHLYNSPGNFTAAKLAWVKEHEPQNYERIETAFLPGDFLAYKLSGSRTTTPSGLSEMILWDFKKQSLATDVCEALGIDAKKWAQPVPQFSDEVRISKQGAEESGLPENCPISFRAGDQPNNAFSLNVLEPGQLATTAGTSAVVYGVSERATCDAEYRVNTFLHVNHKPDATRLGSLLCVNGAGILYSWVKKNLFGGTLNYQELNTIAAQAHAGSEGLCILPFGNGAERTLANQEPGVSFHSLSLTRHGKAHVARACQEGIVFALKYGVDIMKEMGLQPTTVRAGKANLFFSKIFAETFATALNVTVELFDTDGAQGAARGAGVGAGIFGTVQDAFIGLRPLEVIEPHPAFASALTDAYAVWSKRLAQELNM